MSFSIYVPLFLQMLHTKNGLRLVLLEEKIMFKLLDDG